MNGSADRTSRVACLSRPTKDDCQVEAEIRLLWHEYLVETLGIPAAEARPRIEAEVRGQRHTRLLDHLESHGWAFSGATVLDVGCGTGALACALVDRGARFVGVELSPAWAAATSRRLQARGASDARVFVADGARLPLADRSVEFVLCLQVLEHVPMQAAKQVIREIARVLRPGGRAYLAFENYFTFREPHYRVGWLPYLPKRIGAAYLKLLGRNPAFLLERIYYNSVIGLAKACYDSGLSRDTWPNRAARPPRLLPRSLLDTPAIAYAERFQLFRAAFRLELLRG